MKILFSVALALLLVGCASTPVTPGYYTDYEGMDSAEIVRVFRLADYNRILVLPVDASAVSMPLNRNSQSSVSGIISDATAHIARKLQTKVPRRISVTVAAPNTDLKRNAGALIFRPKFLVVHPGSQLARTFVGFGAGKTKVTMEGEFIDGGSGQTLLHFYKTQTRGGGYGPYGLINFNSALLESNEDEIIESIGDLLDKFKR